MDRQGRPRLQKGMHGYLSQKKRHEIIKTILMFGIVLAVFLTGYLHTGKKENLLTVVAIVGVLPASKAAVSMIMFLRSRPVSETLYAQLKPLESKGFFLYDLTFILKETPVKTDCILIREQTLTILTEHTSMAEADISKQLKLFLSNHGKGNCTVKVYKTQKAFLEHVKSQLHSMQESAELEIETKLRNLLFSFSM